MNKGIFTMLVSIGIISVMTMSSYILIHENFYSEIRKKECMITELKLLENSVERFGLTLYSLFKTDSLSTGNVILLADYNEKIKEHENLWRKKYVERLFRLYIRLLNMKINASKSQSLKDRITSLKNQLLTNKEFYDKNEISGKEFIESGDSIINSSDLNP